MGMTITAGESYPIIYELRMSASELDVILLALQNLQTSSVFETTRKELVESYNILSNIRSPKVKGLVRFGHMDPSRLNWK